MSPQKGENIKPASIEVSIPSRLGAEKKAMEEAARVARQMGFSEDRIEDLKTAVAEACVNAIEHGNNFHESAAVGITMTTDESSLTVSVKDKGKGPEGVPVPDLEKKIAGGEKMRGWGIFLISNLMDEVQFLSDSGGGNTVKMVIHLQRQG